MNTVAAAMKKSVLPVFALLLTVAVIFQVRGAGNGSLGTWALTALGVESNPASAAPAPAAPAAEDGGVVAEGRLVTYPGAEVVVGTEVPGTIVRLLVNEKD